jgi:NAD(P)H-hydrate epimerase
MALCAALASSARWHRVELSPGDLLGGGAPAVELGRLAGSCTGSASELATDPGKVPDAAAATRHIPGLVDWLRGFDLVIDALFGTGLARHLDVPVRSLLGALVASGAPVLAVDLPSGLDADDGRLWGPVAPAIGTVTFGAWKPGLLGPQGRALAGDVEVAEIGLPLDLVAALPGLPPPR